MPQLRGQKMRLERWLLSQGGGKTMASVAGSYRTDSDVSPVVVVDINARCASHCVHCSFSKEDQDKDLISIPDLIRALQEAANDGCRHLTVGAREPFMGPAITQRTVELAGAAKQAGFSVAVISSPRFARSGIMALQTAGVAIDALEISLDAFGPAHDTYRGVRGDWVAAE